MSTIIALYYCLFVCLCRTTFDCPMRQLAVQFAGSANPDIGAANLQAIADALNGDPEKSSGCTVTVPPSAPQKFRFGVFSLTHSTVETGSTFYADPVSGSDSNSGTEASPFATVARAVSATRGVSGPNTVVLRAGTFFMNESITLSAGDSGLTIQAFPNEEVWLSRGTALAGVSWKSYNTTGGGWQVAQNQNAVYCGSPQPGKFAINGTYNTWQECESACQANYTSGGPCTIWTWHDNNNPGYDLQCWFREDGQWAPTPQADHVSGYLAPTRNVYVANLASFGFSSVHGLRADGLRMIRARYPNANPEFGFGSDLNANSWIGPNQPIEPAEEFRPTIPFRNTSLQFLYFTLGIGGICAQEGFGFSPPVGYWCSNITE